MTLYQIQYLLAVAETGSVGKAAKELYITQSTISESIRDVEKEYNIQLFERGSRGMILTRKGHDFVESLRQIQQLYDLFQEKYKTGEGKRCRLSIAAHHHVCGEGAFLEYLEKIKNEGYRLQYLEGSTKDILEKVERGEADAGIVFLNKKSRRFFDRELKKRHLTFEQLSERSPYVYMSKSHPLAGEKTLREEQVSAYPFVSYDSGGEVGGLFTAVVRPKIHSRQVVTVSDRAMAYSILRSYRAILIGAGYLSCDKGNSDIICIPMHTENKILIGWIKRDGQLIGEEVKSFIELIRKVYSE